MIRTYIVEDRNLNVIEYARTLHVAKLILERHDGAHRILMIRGHHFGEGFHVYYLVREGAQYRRFYL